MRSRRLVPRQNSIWRNQGTSSEFRSVRHGFPAEETGASETSVNHEDTARGAAKDWRPHLSPQFIFDSEAICSKRASGGQIVTMMQTGKPWSRCDSTVFIGGPGSFTARWRFLCQRMTVRSETSKPSILSSP
jgi:hypothetical protein